jgi:hypothetical protein
VVRVEAVTGVVLGAEKVGAAMAAAAAVEATEVVAMEVAMEVV